MNNSDTRTGSEKSQKTFSGWLHHPLFLTIFFLLLCTPMVLLFQNNYYDNWSQDLFYQRPSGTDHLIRIIAIDEKTLDAYGPFSSWSREKSAELTDLLNRDEGARPAVLAFDIMFIGELDEAIDQKLAESCKNADFPVITAVNAVNDTILTETQHGELTEIRDHIAAVEYPYPALREVTSYGFANTIQDRDSYIRRAIAMRDFADESLPGFAYETYRAYHRLTNDTLFLPQTDKPGSFYFRYAGAPGSYETVSLCDVLDQKVDAQTFRNCIVLVGAYAPGMMDAYPVPSDRSRQMYGVEIQANLIQAYMENNTCLATPVWLTVLLTVLICVSLCLLLRCNSLLLRFMSTVLAILLWILLALLLLRFFHRMTPIALTPNLLIGIYLIHMAGSYLQELFKRRQLLSAFRKFVAPQVVDSLARKDFEAISLGGETRDIAVLFIDIRGFTSLSEALPPEQVVDILNEYLSIVTEKIFANSGTLDKFIGDAAMALFNAPLDLEDYTAKALLTALDICDQTAALNRTLKKRCGKTVSFGIGIHCGPAVVGNIGCRYRMDYTAIGDTVNTAARLESIAGNSQILVSEAVYIKHASDPRFRFKDLGFVSLKGKTREVHIYSVGR